jgi:hypothetical protein
MPDAVHELVATNAALIKLASRSISMVETRQTLHNGPVVVRNRARERSRMKLLGTTDGGRPLTLIIEATIEPTTWLIITGWDTTAAERKMGDG